MIQTFFRKLLFTFSCFFCVYALHAQATLKIISQKDGSALPFVTIVNTSQKTFCYADESGTGKPIASKGDCLRISSVGYETAIIIYAGAGEQQINLTPHIRQLPAVEMRPCNKMQSTTISNAGKDEKYGSFGGVGAWCGMNENARFGVLIKSPMPNAHLNKFSFWAEESITLRKKKPHVPVMLMFYEADSSGLPGELISTSPLIYVINKYGKHTVALDSLQLRIPENGIYVCFGYIPLEQFDFKSTQKTGVGMEKDTIVNCANLRLEGTRGPDFNLAFYNIFKDEWYSPSRRHPNSSAIKATIKCEVVLGYCL